MCPSQPLDPRPPVLRSAPDEGGSTLDTPPSPVTPHPSPVTLTVDDFKQSLNSHVASKGEEIRARYGPHIGSQELAAMFQDRTAVRYPCEIVFDAAPLLEGEVAHALPNGDDPEAGFKICVHPFFSTQPDRVLYLVLYQLVLVNYGPFASADDAETFGASVLGLSKEEYYQALCELADQLDPAQSGC
jgi:hypothetical protein